MLFSVTQWEVIGRALDRYMAPRGHRDADRLELPRIKERVARLLLGDGLLPPSDLVPPGPQPSSPEALRDQTASTVFPVVMVAVLNAFRALPPTWLERETGLATVVGVAVEIARTSPGVNLDAFARFGVRAFLLLDLSEPLKRAIEAVNLAGIQTSPGGDA